MEVLSLFFVSNLQYILIVAILFASYQRFRDNSSVIAKIKFGKFLYFIITILSIAVAYTLLSTKPGWLFLALLLPLILTSFWFYYQFYKIKNSIQEFIYHTCFYGMAITAIFYLYK
ncbi:hypothetical protein SAMN04488096_10576 [Mesonia phycicola]|uniref:DoxX-like family protein n=1 Tax=Mesonia phycicola TaxID=579105 RepID=A0A1M6EGL1_9FLAO|nr:hypothetical protein [Mesonia phycicola]SHI84604.1 hypothetical protein SAMN04488096_10576 [Mesonia phycicola]